MLFHQTCSLTQVMAFELQDRIHICACKALWEHLSTCRKMWAFVHVICLVWKNYRSIKAIRNTRFVLNRHLLNVCILCRALWVHSILCIWNHSGKVLWTSQRVRNCTACSILIYWLQNVHLMLVPGHGEDPLHRFYHQTGQSLSICKFKFESMSGLPWWPSTILIVDVLSQDWACQECLWPKKFCNWQRVCVLLDI